MCKSCRISSHKYYGEGIDDSARSGLSGLIQMDAKDKDKVVSLVDHSKAPKWSHWK